MSNKPKRTTPTPPRPGTAKASAGSSGGPSRTVWLAVGGVAVVAIAVIIALTAGGGSSDVGDQTGFAETIGTPLTPIPEAGADPVIGQPAPLIKAQGFDDQPISVEPADGKGKVIGFYAHWCPHCQAELPRIVDWLENNEVPAGVDVYAVSTGVAQGQPNYPPQTWFERENYPLPVIRDNADGSLVEGYGFSGFPYFVVVGGDGNVLGRVSGELSTPQWEALLELAASGATATGDATGGGSE